MKLTVVIEKGEDMYSAYASENIGTYCPGGFGNSVEEAKLDFYECVNEMKEIAIEEGAEWPGEIEFDFAYDIPSFFNCFDWINVSKFAKEAHINASKMRAYKNGICTASEKTMEKISDTLKKLVVELQTATI